MPTSWYQAIPDIIEQVVSLQPTSILDVGIGFGKYGALLRESLDIAQGRYDKENWKIIIDGIEGFARYRNPIHDYIYNKIYYGDVFEILNFGLPKYDCILLIDVLEHFTKEEGFKLINNLLLYTNKSLIISTPLFPDYQEEYLGNYMEHHLSRWSIIDFSKYDFSFKQINIGDNAAQIFHIFPQKVSLKDNKKITTKPKLSDKKLNIGYILPHKNLTGGMKMLLLQMNELSKRGHNIFAFYRGDNDQSVLPDWLEVNTFKNILVPYNESYTKYTEECDVLFVGWIQQVLELKDSDIPLVYWEQGNEWIFGDFNNLFMDSIVRKVLVNCYSSNIKLASVSSIVQKILKVRYNKDSTIISNFIDCNFYYPSKHEFNNTILLVGNPVLRFKGFNIALKSLQKLWTLGYRFKVKWICQVIPNISGISFPIEFIEKPAQHILAKEYRNADICLFTSWYEGFGMIPLEAMASGTPVVTTDCGGISDYVIPGFNALVAEPGDIDSLAGAVGYLLENENARLLLSHNGRETALKFSPENIIPKLEEFLFNSLE